MKNLFYTLFIVGFVISCGTENLPIHNFTATATPTEGGTIEPSLGQFSEGKSLEVRAIPSEGWEFVRWEGDWTQSDNPARIMINKEYNVIGVFQRRKFGLNITIVGEGTVTERNISSPQKTMFPYETVVELTARNAVIANEIWEFSGWSGDVTGNDNPKTIEITKEMNITATFTKSQLRFGEVYNPVTGRTWMDRNLGATRVATSSTDSEAYGDLYQWGRRSDGHEKRNSPTTSTLSSTDTPTHGSFILAPNSPHDWRTPQNNNLWQGVNGINNPCPVGYRLPTEAEWNAELSSWNSSNPAGAFASPLKLPVAGARNRSSGVLGVVGSDGYYWSSSLTGNFTRGPGFYSGTSGMLSGFRATGASVRCIKD